MTSSRATPNVAPGPSVEANVSVVDAVVAVNETAPSFQTMARGRAGTAAAGRVSVNVEPTWVPLTFTAIVGARSGLSGLAVYRNLTL